MKNFEVVFYESEKGGKPVEEFIDSLPAKVAAKVVGDLELLEKFGNHIGEPLSKAIGNGIFELRTRYSKTQIRCLYFFCYGGKIIVTNGFVKKTDKTPRREISLAEKRRAEYIKRKGN